LSDARLAAVLASVGDHLVVPAPEAGAAVDASPSSPPMADPRSNGSTGIAPPEDEADRPGPSGLSTTGADRADGDDAEHIRDRWRGRTRLLVAAAIVTVIALASLIATPAREAVADWFGLGSTGIERVGPAEGDPTGLPYLVDGMEAIDQETAERALRAPLPAIGSATLGPAEVLGAPPEGGVLMAWSDHSTTLWVRRTDLPADQAVGKLGTVEDDIVEVDGLGDAAIKIEGVHVLETPLRRLAADNVVIWLDGDFELRLESDAPVDDLIALAHSISPG
jgi:hypothetical protein